MKINWFLRYMILICLLTGSCENKRSYDSFECMDKEVFEGGRFEVLIWPTCSSCSDEAKHGLLATEGDLIRYIILTRAQQGYINEYLHAPDMNMIIFLSYISYGDCIEPSYIYTINGKNGKIESKYPFMLGY